MLPVLENKPIVTKPTASMIALNRARKFQAGNFRLERIADGTADGIPPLLYRPATQRQRDSSRIKTIPSANNIAALIGSDHRLGAIYKLN